MDTLDATRLLHLREQREAQLSAALQEYQGLLQALEQNQRRRTMLRGQLVLVDELLQAMREPAPPAPE